MTGIKSYAQLKKLQDKFGTDHAIAMQYSVSRQAIHQMRNKFGIDTNNKKLRRNVKIKKDWIKGFTADRLVKKYKISLTMIYRILNKYKEVL